MTECPQEGGFFLNAEREPRRFGARAHCTTVLDYLRGCGLVGTKEGCASGDCGACTAVVAEEERGSLRYKPLNTCIALLPMLHGRQLITVDGLSEGGLHPVQKAMVRKHGSQCGFCTPGFVMSMFAYYKQGAYGREEAVRAISGNLCRCTGYRPIVDAALSLRPRQAADRFAAAASETAARLESLAARRPAPTAHWAAPRTVAELACAVADRGKARIVAGGTDLALSITQDLLEPDLIFAGDIAAMSAIKETRDTWLLGGAATWDACGRVMAAHLPGFGKLLERFGSPQIRLRATVGGNLGNASPVADGPPVMLVLGSIVRLRRGKIRREVALENFFTGYRRTVLQPGEFIESVRVGKPPPHALFAVHKVSKRREDDISSLCGAFLLRFGRSRMIVSARVAFGGMAEVPRRAPRCEAALTGADWGDKNTAVCAAQALAGDYVPISDARASAQYRARVAANLVMKVWHNSTGGEPDLEDLEAA